jgi:hypothetical protein
MSKLRTFGICSVCFVAGAASTLGLVRAYQKPTVPGTVGNTILISPELVKELDRVHARQQWIDDEILFREALKRGYALDDLIVRHQLQQRMRRSVNAEFSKVDPGDDALEAFRKQHAMQYLAQARWSFEQVYLSRSAHVSNMDATIQSIAAQLHKGQSAAGLGDPFLSGNVVTDQPDAVIERDFGGIFVKALATLPSQGWQGPVTSGLGQHFIRITAHTPARELTLAEIRPRLLIDWREDQNHQALENMLAPLRPQYHVVTGKGPLQKMQGADEEDNP